MIVTWEKVAGVAKWAGFETIQHPGKPATKHHRLTIIERETSWQIWVDGGKGFQRVADPVILVAVPLADVKSVAVQALEALRQKIAGRAS